jgi:hypothetical protein
LILEVSVGKIVFLLIVLVSVFKGEEHVEEGVEGGSSVQLDGNGVHEGSTKLGLFDSDELGEVGGGKCGGKNCDN